MRTKCPAWTKRLLRFRSDDTKHSDSSPPSRGYKHGKLTTPKLDLSSVSKVPPNSPPPMTPDSPPPRDGCDEREVRRQLDKLAGRPTRVRSLLSALLCAKHVTPSLVSQVADALISDKETLRELVQVIACAERPPPRAPVSVAGPPRERLRLAWAASNLIVAGPPSLRRAVCSDVELLKLLADTFTAFNFDSARATLACDVLSVALADCPRAASAATSEREKFVDALIAHIDTTPALDVLGRMAGTREYGRADVGAVTPAHKRSLAALARQRVQDVLAERFERAAKKEPDICSHAAAAMAELTERTTPHTHVPEDPDERFDGYAFGITHLRIVPAHVYNDAIDYLNLALAPQPLAKVLDVAEMYNENVAVVVPASELLARTLRATMHARNSSLPLVSTAAKSRKLTKLEDVLLPRMAYLLPIVCGKSALAAAAVFEAMCALLVVCSDATFTDLICTHAVLDALLDALAAKPNASVLRARVSDALCDLLQRTQRQRALTLLYHTKLLDTPTAASLPAVFELVLALGDDTGFLALCAPWLEQKLKLTCDSCAPLVADYRRDRSRGLFRELVHDDHRSSTSSKCFNIKPRKPEPTEDRGKLLYAISAIPTPAGSVVEAAHAAILGVTRLKDSR